MDNLPQMQRPGDWRPVVWLIGFILLVHGIEGAISYNPFGIWQSERFFSRGMDYALVNIASIAVHLVISVGLIAAGVGLWRREPWARRMAVGLLECLIVFTILIAFVKPVLSFPVDQTSYWMNMLQSLQPFTLIANLIMLLALLMPVERQVPGEEPPPGIFTGVAEGIRRRLAAGTPPLWLFIGLLFLCWGAEPWLNQLNLLNLLLSGLPLLSILPRQPLLLFTEFAGLLPALAYLMAGVWLLLNWQWSRQAAMAAIILDIVYQVYMSIFSLVLGFQHVTPTGRWDVIWFILLLPFNVALQLAIPVVILLLLRKASPLASAEENGEPVREG